jgi:hypothetical protein
MPKVRLFMSARSGSLGGAELRLLAGRDGAQMLCVDKAGDSTVSSVSYLLNIIWTQGCVSLRIPPAVARFMASGLRACVACITHEGGGALNAALNDEGSPVREVWPLFCLFHLVANTPARTDGMIVFDTSWMLRDNPIDPATLPTGTHVDPFAQRQLELLGAIESEAQTPWGRLTSGWPRCTQVGGMQTAQLEALATSLTACPRVVFFPSRQIAAEILVSLLWAGRFMCTFAPADMRTPLITRSLCMLSFILGTDPEVNESGHVTYSRLPRPLEWPNGGNWGNVPKVFAEAAAVYQRLQRNLTAPAGS